VGWKESDCVSQRQEFVRLAEAEGFSMTELCQRFGVSRKTGYKWLRRWKAEGFSGLTDRSRRPKKSQGRTDPKVELAIVDLRTQHPCWGGRKLRRVLQDQGIQGLPTASTITRILNRHGLISASKSSKHTAFTNFERTEPNDLWQIDFKGDFKLSRGGRCYPLTLLDDHSRFSLGVIACDNQRGKTVQDHFRHVFFRYGIPRSIYVDNGNPWGTSRHRTRHSRVSVWLMRQDIQVIHGRPYHPQGRGKIERFHRTLKEEVLQDRQFENLEQTQAAFDPWREVYNQVRPHDALDLAVPATRYRPSHRSFVEVSGPYQYSAHFEVRRTNPSGQFSFKKQKYQIGDAFTDQAIGLLPTTTDGLWELHYCRFRIGSLDQRSGQIVYDRRLAASRSARFSQAAEEAGKPASKP